MASSELSTNVAGATRLIMTNPSINVNGVWRAARLSQTNVSGAWRTVKNSYNYGTGSGNTVSNWYNNILKVNGTLVTSYFPYSTYDCYTGNGTQCLASRFNNFNGYAFTRINLDQATFATEYHQLIYSGTNNYSYTQTVPAESTINLNICGNGYTSGAIIGGLKLCVGGVYYTLQDCVNNGYIYPIVILQSMSDTEDIWSNVLNLYTAGTTDSSGYTQAQIYVMTKTATTGFQLYANKSFNTVYDGWSAWFCPIDTYRLTIQ